MTDWRKVMCLLLAITGSGFWYAWPWRAPVDAERWVQIEPQSLQQWLGLAGRLQAARRIIVAAPFDGVMAAVAVTHGQHVKTGDTLFRLDTAQLAVELRQAEATWLKARANTATLEAWVAGPEVARARRMLASARNALATSRAALDENQRLFERGIVAGMEVRNLAQQVESQHQLLLDAEQDLEQTLAQGQGDALRIARMELANAQAHRTALVALREQQEVKAPFSALVVNATASSANASQRLQPGLPVARGTPLVELIDLGQIQVLAAVEQQDLPTVHEGQLARVTVAGQVFQGRVAHIAQMPRTEGAQDAWYDLVADVDLPSLEPGRPLRLGMSAQVEVLVSSKDRVWVVPPDAVEQDKAGLSYVWFREHPNQLPSKVPVSIGSIWPQGLEVAGLRSGYVRLP